MREEIHADTVEKPVHAPQNGRGTEKPTRSVQTRTLQAEIRLIIGIAEDGLPVATVPVPGANQQALTLSWKDPEGRDRDIWDRARLLAGEAELKLGQQWVEQEE
jgi:hypothetical protein